MSPTKQQHKVVVSLPLDKVSRYCATMKDHYERGRASEDGGALTDNVHIDLFSDPDVSSSEAEDQPDSSVAGWPSVDRNRQTLPQPPRQVGRTDATVQPKQPTLHQQQQNEGDDTISLFDEDYSKLMDTTESGGEVAVKVRSNTSSSTTRTVCRRKKRRSPSTTPSHSTSDTDSSSSSSTSDGSSSSSANPPLVEKKERKKSTRKRVRTDTGELDKTSVTKTYGRTSSSSTTTTSITETEPTAARTSKIHPAGKSEMGFDDGEKRTSRDDLPVSRPVAKRHSPPNTNAPERDEERHAKKRWTVRFADNFQPKPAVLGQKRDDAGADRVTRDRDENGPMPRKSDDPFWRDVLVGLVSDTRSNRTLFLHALVEDGICYGYTAASSINLCEGSGVQYDVRRRRLITDRETKFSRSMEKVWRRRNWTRSRIDPRDIVRFAVLNTESPIVIGCDLDRLVSTDRQSVKFLDLCCRLDDLDGASLSITNGKHACFDCYPYVERAAVFVTSGDVPPQLFCHYHARTRVNETDFLLYRPTLVTVSANEKHMWISTYVRGGATGKEADRWSPVVCSELTRIPLLPRAEFRDAELLLNIATDNGMEWRNNDHLDPTNVVRTLQNLCTGLNRQRLCSPTVELIPASRASRHSDSRRRRDRTEEPARNGHRSRTVEPNRSHRSRTVEPNRSHHSPSKLKEPSRRRRSPIRTVDPARSCHRSRTVEPNRSHRSTSRFEESSRRRRSPSRTEERMRSSRSQTVGPSMRARSP